MPSVLHLVVMIPIRDFIYINYEIIQGVKKIWSGNTSVHNDLKSRGNLYIYIYVRYHKQGKKAINLKAVGWKITCQFILI